MPSVKRAEPIFYLVGGILIFIAGVALIVAYPHHWWSVAAMVIGLVNVMFAIRKLRSRGGESTPGSTPPPR
jgi:hypothetical protein